MEQWNNADRMKIIAIIPAFNEYTLLNGVIEKTLRYVNQVVVVDDGSREPLAHHLSTDARVKVLRHIINLGKGAALKTGVHWAKREGCDIAIFIDADGQHDPHEIPALLGPIIRGQADIVFGVRKFHGRMPFMARFGNLVLTKILQFMFRISVDDTQSGYRAIRLASFDKIAWKSPRYSVETEMIVNAGKHNVPYQQVPITTIYHDKYKGTTVIDGIRIMINMIAWRFL